MENISANEPCTSVIENESLMNESTNDNVTITENISFSFENINDSVISDDSFSLEHSIQCDVNSIQCDRIEIDVDYHRVIHENLTCTVRDALSLIYAYSSRHNLNWTAIEDLIRLVNTIIDNNTLVPSKYMFRKMFEEKNKIKSEVHFWCHKCEKYLGTKNDIQTSNANECQNCDTDICTDVKYKKNHFISLPVRENVKNVLEQNSENLILNTNISPHTICDVHDSENFKRLKQEMGNVKTCCAQQYLLERHQICKYFLGLLLKKLKK